MDTIFPKHSAQGLLRPQQTGQVIPIHPAGDQVDPLLRNRTGPGAANEKVIGQNHMAGALDILR